MAVRHAGPLHLRNINSEMQTVVTNPASNSIPIS